MRLAGVKFVGGAQAAATRRRPSHTTDQPEFVTGARADIHTVCYARGYCQGPAVYSGSWERACRLSRRGHSDTLMVTALPDPAVHIRRVSPDRS